MDSEIEGFQRRLEELEADLATEKKRVEIVFAAKNDWADQARRSEATQMALTAALAEQRKRADELEAECQRLNGCVAYAESLRETEMEEAIRQRKRAEEVEESIQFGRELLEAAETRAEEAEALMAEARLRVLRAEAQWEDKARTLDRTRAAAIEKARQEERERCAGLAWKVGLGIEAYALRQEISSAILASESQS